mgnify:FL=1
MIRLLNIKKMVYVTIFWMSTDLLTVVLKRMKMEIMNSKINTVIFDLDGTLLDTLKDLQISTNYALKKHGMKERTLDEVRCFVGNGVAKLIERAIDGGLENKEYAEVLEDFKNHYKLHCNDNTAPYDGIPALLSELKKSGMKMAIVSNKFDAAVKELNSLYFADFIQVAIGESEKIKKKPAPDTVNAAIEELGSCVTECVYVGDSDVDIMTAKNVGIPCISVTWGFRDEDELKASGGTVFADVPADILKICASEE